jgi:hypothetical protein
MKRTLVLLPAAFLVLAACSEPKVAVQATLPNVQTNEPAPLARLPIRLLPYDRDAIFDSLASVSEEPEPAIPQEILERQRAVQAAQAEWQTATDRWGEARDRLKTLSDQLQQMQQRGQRNTPEYRQRFQQFGTLEREETAAQQARDQAFARFTSLQEAVIRQGDSIRAVREAWADRAFQDYDRVVEARLKTTRREELADTTDASGLATLRAPKGQWWVYARYQLPYSELYWNIPVSVDGDSVLVQLTPDNAQERPPF